MYWIFPISQKLCIFNSKGKSLSFSFIVKADFIAKAGIIDQLFLYLLFLVISTEKEDFPSTKPVNQFGERFNVKIPFSTLSFFRKSITFSNNL